MTRHTGEVDICHLGDRAVLGTRHGVQHDADSARQQRIANTTYPTYRRFYYFLAADERVGDLMRADVDSDETFLGLDPLREIRTEPYTPDRRALSGVFGLNDLCAEPIGLIDMPKHKEAYLDCCRYFNATKAEQTARHGSHFGSLLLFQGQSRMDAYAAVQTGDEKLDARAWEKFYNSDGYQESAPWKTEKVSGPVTTIPGSEADGVHTNDTALYGLAAIENLALVGDHMPA